MKRILITGASSGIGRACALEFSACFPDAHLIVIGRNSERLAEVGGEAHVCDLKTKEGQDQACQLIQQYIPDLVINSAGLGYYGPALSHSLEEEEEITEVNIVALQKLTLTAAKALKNAGKPGTIVNISSAAGYLSFPGSATYAASKAFVNRFSEALDFELQGRGIRVLAFCPGMVATEFSKRASKGKPLALARRSVLSPEKVVKGIMKQIEKGEALTIYDWRYWLGIKLLPLAPKRWLARYLEKRVS